MPTLDDLFGEYGRRRFPANIGDEVAGVRLGELDDEVQDVIGSYCGMGLEVGMWRVARLGLAYGDIMRVLPHILQEDTRTYFVWLADLARAGLESMRELDLTTSRIDDEV